MTFKPMLAGKAEPALLQFPLLASPKLDGVRSCVVEGQLRSRALKPFPNLYTQHRYSMRRFNGFDGEFTLGEPTASDVFLRTSEALRRIEGFPQLTLWLFDDWSHPGDFQRRYEQLRGRVDNRQATALDIRVLEHIEVKDAQDLDFLEQEWTAQGYEGVMLRSPSGPYKHGRSTAREGWLLKLKRFDDAEAVVVGVEEEMHNGNEATTNELGRTKRSSHKEGKVGKGTMGALVVRGLNGQFEGVEFNIGTGFTAADRAAAWHPGEVVKYKFFAVGTKDKPRHPVYLGRRLKEDVS